MGDELSVWGSDSGAPATVRGIVSPPEAGGSFRQGGKSELSSVEVELSAADVAVLGIEDGWRLRWQKRDYRISRLVFQGGTVTAICGPVGEQL